tara:strand:+ start:602 stop:1606 length:1005 start_codon:yes stop_codon:yes gene_type:complete
MDIKLLLFIIFLLVFFYLLKSNNTIYPTEINNTELGFVKPEHKLLKILNSISSGSKVKLDGICNRYIYNKNTMQSDLKEKLSNKLKNIISDISSISSNEYYIKDIENVYSLISCNQNQRYFVDFFIYDLKNYYSIRLITDFVIIDNETYINYMNVQSGSNPTILNKYDVKFNNSGILFDSNMFKENIDQLFDSYYNNSFEVIGVKESSLDYSNTDLSSVYSEKSLKNMYFPSSVSKDTIRDFEKRDLSGYIEMYLPENQNNIRSPMFCNKYKLDWDKYGVPNLNDNSDKDCYLNNNATIPKYNEPWNGPGYFNNQVVDATHYDFLLKNSIDKHL